MSVCLGRVQKLFESTPQPIPQSLEVRSRSSRIIQTYWKWFYGKMEMEIKWSLKWNMGDLMSSSNCKIYPKNSFDPANFGSKSFWDQNIFFNPNISETKTVFGPRKFYLTSIFFRPTINFYWPNFSWAENSKKKNEPKLIDNLQIIGTRKFLEANDIFWT